MNRRAAAVLMCAVMAANLFTACSGKEPAGQADAPAVQEDAQAGDTSAVPEEEGTQTDLLSSVDMGPFTSADPSEYVKLPDLSGLVVSVPPREEVTDETVEEEYSMYIENATFLADVEDRDTIREGDVVNIDYAQNGAPEEAASGKGYNLEIGTAVFGEEFDSALTEMKKGETKEIAFTYPEDYYDEELRGKEVSFTVTVNSVMQYEKPASGEEVISSFGLVMEDGTEVNSEDTLKRYIRENLEKESEESYLYYAQSKAIMAMAEKAEMIKDFPEDLTDTVMDYILGSLGMKKDDLDEETMKSFEEYVAEYTKEQMCVNLVAQQQQFECSDSEVIENMQVMYGDEAEEMFRGLNDADRYTYRSMVLRDKVADYILGMAKVVEEEDDSASRVPD